MRGLRVYSNISVKTSAMHVVVRGQFIMDSTSRAEVLRKIFRVRSEEDEGA